jgi:D-alanyl-D-alanine carboxypeptidase
VVVAEGIAGSVQNFCVLMNQLKDRIGMRNTNFKNPSGLFDVGQFTTAMDIAKLGMALYKDFPQYRPFLSMKTFRFGGAIYQTHCKILHWCDAVDGAKTGYIRQSGFNIYVTAHNPVNGLRIFIVVTGWDSQKSRDLYVSQLLHKWLKTASLGPGQNHAHKDSVTLQQRNESLYSQMIAPSNSQNDQRLTNPKSSQQPVQFVPVMPPAKKSTPHSNNDDVSRRDGADEVICQDDEVSVPAVKLPEDLDTLYADEAILAESEFEICN